MRGNFAGAVPYPSFTTIKVWKQRDQNMPVELAIVIVMAMVIGVGGVVALTKIIVNAAERRRSAAAGPSLTSGELSRLIANAVEEATQPLQEKVDRLQRRLEPSEPQRLLAAGDDDVDD